MTEPSPGLLSGAGPRPRCKATGRFRTRADAARHLEAGATKVILSAPRQGSGARRREPRLGVNFDEVYDPARHHIVTNASCTTNCLAPVAKVLHETVGSVTVS